MRLKFQYELWEWNFNSIKQLSLELQLSMRGNVHDRIWNSTQIWRIPHFHGEMEESRKRELQHLGSSSFRLVYVENFPSRGAVARSRYSRRWFSAPGCPPRVTFTVSLLFRRSISLATGTLIGKARPPRRFRSAQRRPLLFVAEFTNRDRQTSFILSSRLSRS